jgi:hypothetical protein
MTKKINKNFFLSVVVGGIVVANYYANSLAVLEDLKKDYPGCEIEAFDVSKYGFSFGDAPVINVEGGPMVHHVICRETGERWDSVKACCEAIGCSLKTLYTSLRRGSRLYGYHYDYFD